MKLIVGLGNPGEKYKKTRHNVGYLVVERIAADKKLSAVDLENKFIQSKKFNADICQLQAKGEKVILAKPRTFMNLSGESVLKMMQYYKLDISDLIIISDDVDIPLGQIRIRLEGSSGGHKGVQNIIDVLGTNQFVRVRIGILDNNINSRENYKKENIIDTKDYVLSEFKDSELPLLDKVITQASKDIIKCIGSKDTYQAQTTEIVY